MSIYVRRNPALAVLEIVAGGLFLLFFLFMLAAGVPLTAGCFVLFPPIALVVDGIRRLNNRGYLSYDPQRRTIVVSSGRSSEAYRAEPGERFVVTEDGRIAIVGAGGGRRPIPAGESSAVREDWQSLVTVIRSEDAGPPAGRP